MSTIYFPWDWLADKGRLMGLMVENIQYPWRLLGIISFFLSLLICSILIIIYKNNALLAKRLMLLIGASAIVGGGVFYEFTG